MLEPEVETRPWEQQLALDDVAFREQLDYLLERSPFYREKLKGAVPAGLDRIAGLPLTEKQELRTTVTRDDPFGAHLAAPRGEIVRSNRRRILTTASGAWGRGCRARPR